MTLLNTQPSGSTSKTYLLAIAGYFYSIFWVIRRKQWQKVLCHLRVYMKDSSGWSITSIHTKYWWVNYWTKSVLCYCIESSKTTSIIPFVVLDNNYCIVVTVIPFNIKDETHSNNTDGQYKAASWSIGLGKQCS